MMNTLATLMPWLVALLCLGGLVLRGAGRRPMVLLFASLPWLALLLSAAGDAEWFDVPWLRLGMPQLAFPACLTGTVAALHLLRPRGNPSPRRRVLLELTWGAALSSLALAAMRPELGMALDRVTLLLLVDRSRSMEMVADPDARLAAEQRLATQSMRAEDLLGVLAFGATAALEEPPHPRQELPPPQHAPLSREATDLEAALRRGLAELPPDSAARLVVFSDGVATRGDALAAAAAARASGVPIDTIALDRRPMDNLRVEEVTAPGTATRDEPFELRIVASATRAMGASLRVSEDGETVSEGTLELNSGQSVLRLRQNAGKPGFHRWDVELAALDPTLDPLTQDNRASTFLRTRGQALALVLEDPPGAGRATAEALRASGLLVDVKGPLGSPADLGQLAAYDLVVVAGLSADAFTPEQLTDLNSFTSAVGGGLLLMGSPRAFGPGGWARTPVEEVSPVSFDLKQERRRGSLAEVILIDYSGSMSARAGSHTKLELANEAAARSAAVLGAGDELGVAHVDTEVRWTVPLQAVTAPAALANTIRGVAPGGGGILVDLALRNGYQALAQRSANLRHVLLFADGSDAEERTHAPALVASAAAAGVTTSVVSLGRGPDSAALEKLSRVGGGRFYLVEDATRLPAIFAQETVIATRSAIHEGPFNASAAAPSPLLRNVDLAQAPALGGYVITVPKPRAEVLATALEGDPLLAQWSVGLGRVAVFASDYGAAWGGAWSTWPSATTLFGQLGRALMRRDDDADLRLVTEVAGGVLRLRASAIDDQGRAESFLRLTAHIAGPDGFSWKGALQATGTGQYETAVTLERPGAYVVTAVEDGDGGRSVMAGVVASNLDELRPAPTDRKLLQELSELTGGKVRDTLAGVFAERPTPRRSFRDFTAWLALSGALSLLFGVGARRLSAPELPARARAWLRAARQRLQRERRAQVAVAGPSTAEVLLRARTARRSNPVSPDVSRGGTAPQPPPATPAPVVPQPAARVAGSALGAPPRPAPAATVQRPAAAPTPGPEGTQAAKSTAELLLERRRQRQRP